jgi:hypothetical protein
METSTMNAAMVLRVPAGYLCPKALRMLRGVRISAVRWTWVIVVFFIGVAFVDHNSVAGVVLDTSSITATFTPDTSDPTTTFSASGSDSLSFNPIYNVDGGNASAFVNMNVLGYLAAFDVGTFTGVQVHDPNDVIQGATTLDIVFSSTWTVTAGGYGPPLINYAHIPILSTNLNQGDVGEFRVLINYGPDNENAPYVADKMYTQFGLTADTFSHGVLHDPLGYTVGQTLQVSGELFFSFSGQDGGVYFGEDVTEVGAATPEPSSLMLMSMGIVALVFGSRRRRRRGSNEEKAPGTR